VKLHAVEAGRGPLVVLLHGFPEFWWSWRLQIPALAAAGFHVVAPDLRGYNLSDRPPDVADYGLEHLAADVAGVIRAMGETKAHVVGHDWGGLVAWAFAMAYPEMLDRLAILNVPHPVRLERALLSSPRQIAKSWYIFGFQVHVCPNVSYDRTTTPTEAHAPSRARARRPRGRGPALRGRGPTRRGTPRRHQLLPRRDTWRRQPDAPCPSRHRGARPRDLGERDIFLGRELAEPPSRWVKNARVEYLANASHWVQLDEPERVNALLPDFSGENFSLSVGHRYDLS